MSAPVRTANPTSKFFMPMIGSGTGEPGGSAPTAPTAFSRETRDEDERDRTGGPTGEAFALVMAAHVTNAAKPPTARNPPTVTSPSPDHASSSDDATTRVGAGADATPHPSSTAGPTAAGGERSTDVATVAHRAAAADVAEVPNAESTPVGSSAGDRSATDAPPAAETTSEPVPTDLTDRLRFNTRTMTAGASHATPSPDSVSSSDSLSTPVGPAAASLATSDSTDPAGAGTGLTQPGAGGGEATPASPTVAETDPPTTAPTTTPASDAVLLGTTSVPSETKPVNGARSSETSDVLPAFPDQGETPGAAAPTATGASPVMRDVNALRTPGSRVVGETSDTYQSTETEANKIETDAEHSADATAEVSTGTRAAPPTTAPDTSPSSGSTGASSTPSLRSARTDSDTSTAVSAASTKNGPGQGRPVLPETRTPADDAGGKSTQAPGPAPTIVAPVPTQPTARSGSVEAPAHLSRPDLPRNVSDQVITAVKRYEGTDGEHRMSLELNPRGLGMVAIDLTIEGSTVHLHMTAEHASTGELLRSALDGLRTSLADGGFTSGSLDVNHQAGRQAMADQQQGNQPQNPQSRLPRGVTRDNSGQSVIDARSRTGDNPLPAAAGGRTRVDLQL